MTIDKLPSGSYRIRLTENGKSYSMTVPYKPTKKEAHALIQGKINHSQTNGKSFQDAAEEYISVKEHVLSPSTFRNYKSLLRNLPEEFKSLDISAIGDYEVQKLINEYAVDHEAKSVHNVNGFVLSVIRLFYPKSTISTTLPQKPHTEHYTPSYEDVKAILEEAKNTRYYVPVFLAILGCRNSEICALTIADLNEDTITINKAYVRSENGYVLKNVPKTDASNRKITLPPDLADRIREQGYIYEGYPQQIYKFLRRTQKKLGIPSFGIHRCRHFFASYMHDLGYSDAVIQSLGGWSTDNVMKSVYRHAMNEDEVRQTIKKDFSFS